MTIVIGAISVMLSLAFSMGVFRVANVVADRARAQTAADAAALAAVAEAALSGSGDPRAEAARFARLNDAVLDRCLCGAGATAAQVQVSLGAATARARAAFDPERVLPAALPAGRLHPLLAAAIDRLVVLSDNRVFVVSGLRSSAEQSALWADAVREHGGPEAADDWVARPGTSKHELGLAVDLGGDLALARELIARFGLPLGSPLQNEPWHFELIVP